MWTHRPTAWLPPAISLAALAFVLAYAAIAGIAPHAGERAPARVFQLLLLTDAILIAWFAVRWLPREPRGAPRVLALQLACAVVPVAVVVLLESLA
jgi:hypothetical protein